MAHYSPVSYRKREPPTCRCCLHTQRATPALILSHVTRIDKHPAQPIPAPARRPTPRPRANTHPPPSVLQPPSSNLQSPLSLFPLPDRPTRILGRRQIRQFRGSVFQIAEKHIGDMYHSIIPHPVGNYQKTPIYCVISPFRVSKYLPNSNLCDILT